MYRKEQRDLLIRLVVAVIAVIPIFIIGIVYMSLLNEGSPGRKYFETPIWAGQVTRGEWALFFASTPVMFYAAEVRLWLISSLVLDLTVNSHTGIS
jgi:Cu+-exporting ATPase